MRRKYSSDEERKKAQRRCERARAARFRDAGLCPRCGQQPEEGGFVLCRKHRYEEHLRYTYGLGLEDFHGLAARQFGQCAICGNDEVKLVVDHSHDTGQVRGLLCKLCNSGISFLQDSPTIMENAAKYIRQAEGAEDQELLSEAWRVIRDLLMTGKSKLSNGEVLEPSSREYIQVLKWVASLKPQARRSVPKVEDFLAAPTEPGE